MIDGRTDGGDGAPEANFEKGGERAKVPILRDHRLASAPVTSCVDKMVEGADALEEGGDLAFARRIDRVAGNLAAQPEVAG